MKSFRFSNILSFFLYHSVIGNDVGGPLAVMQTGAQMAQYSPLALVGFAATLSVNLAVLNALPFPALDGGQLAFVLVELLSGKPLPKKVQETMTAVAFAMLLSLGVSTLVGDIGKMGMATLPMDPPTAITTPVTR